MKERPPAYKFEEFETEEPKTPEELKEAKLKAGVKSHEQVLRDALREGIKTGDKLLIENAIKGLKKVGVAEYLLELKQQKEKKKEEVKEREISLSELQKEVLDEVIQKLASGKKETEERLRNRFNYLYEKLGSFEGAINQLEFEEKVSRRCAKPKIPFIESNGIVEKIIREYPRDLFPSL